MLLLQTDYGLAVVGTTKNGGMSNPFAFHANLANGSAWGESFRSWYDDMGKEIDEWHLGMVLLGDPLLVLSVDVVGMMEREPAKSPTCDQIETLRKTITRFALPQDVDSFESYKRSYPQFFTD